MERPYVEAAAGRFGRRKPQPVFGDFDGLVGAPARDQDSHQLADEHGADVLPVFTSQYFLDSPGGLVEFAAADGKIRQPLLIAQIARTLFQQGERRPRRALEVQEPGLIAHLAIQGAKVVRCGRQRGIGLPQRGIEFADGLMAHGQLDVGRGILGIVLDDLAKGGAILLQPRLTGGRPVGRQVHQGAAAFDFHAGQAEPLEIGEILLGLVRLARVEQQTDEPFAGPNVFGLDVVDDAAVELLAPKGLAPPLGGLGQDQQGLRRFAVEPERFQERGLRVLELVQRFEGGTF